MDLCNVELILLKAVIKKNYKHVNKHLTFISIKTYGWIYQNLNSGKVSNTKYIS